MTNPNLSSSNYQLGKVCDHWEQEGQRNDRCEKVGG